MTELRTKILSAIASRDQEHAEKLQHKLNKLGKDYDHLSEAFFGKYVSFLAQEGLDINYAVDCYMKMVRDVLTETLYFFRTGQYSATSFADVNEKVYGKPEVMEYYMHGLILSQFLWSHHFQVFKFFCRTLQEIKYQRETNHYLEIGAGHGLYLSEAIKILGSEPRYSVVDISPTSIELCKRFVDNPRVSYQLTNVFEYEITQKFDFVTLGEVLEHLEDPQAMLEVLSKLLSDNGLAFITVPTNAPAIDHIYLFKNQQQIEKMLRIAGLEVVNQQCFYSEDHREYPDLGIQTPMIYAAVLRKVSDTTPDADTV